MIPLGNLAKLLRFFPLIQALNTFAGNFTIMKKWFLVAVSYMVLICALMTAVSINKKTEEKWKRAEANVKAYDNLLGASEDKNIAYQLTVEQLNNMNDSIMMKLNEARKQVKVKDKNLKSVHYVKSTFVRVDTLVMNDTIFKDKHVDVDTIVGDKWYRAGINLKYPSTIVVKPEFRSEKSIIVSTKKETVNPSKKFWLFRLFQKKHTVVKVDVIENNPYVQGEESRYVEMVK